MFWTIIIRIFKKLIWIYYKWLCKGQLYGEQNLPAQPFVLAANHVSYLDWIILYIVFKKFNRKIVFIAKDKLLKNLFFRKLLEHSDTIAIHPGQFKKGNLRDIIKVINNDGIIGIFPEGERSRGGSLIKAYSGAAEIALMKNTPIVPVGLNGFYEALPSHKKIPKITKLSICIGSPITSSIIADKKISSAKKAEILTRQVMNEIAKLTNQEYKY